MKRKPSRCRTGHGAYGFILMAGARHAQCSECGHIWMVVLGTGSADGLPVEMPGIALR